MPRGGPTAALVAHFLFFTVANVLVLNSTDSPHISPRGVSPSGEKMKAVPPATPEELARLRGLVQAAWTRLQRGDLDTHCRVRAALRRSQEEYEQARDDLHQDAGNIVVIADDGITLCFEEAVPEAEEHDPNRMAERTDGSGEPRRPLRDCALPSGSSPSPRRSSSRWSADLDVLVA